MYLYIEGSIQTRFVMHNVTQVASLRGNNCEAVQGVQYTVRKLIPPGNICIPNSLNVFLCQEAVQGLPKISNIKVRSSATSNKANNGSDQKS